jgi:uncharacterized alkaline shock family protein YloU
MADKNEKTVVPGRNYPVPEPKQEDAGLGKLELHNNVYAIIAHDVADNVPGVLELSGTLVDGLADIIGGKKTRDRGIRVAVGEEEAVTIELTVILEFGVNIPETCFKLQSEVRQAVEDMTGKVVQAVNVSVQGLRRSVKPQPEG